MKRFVSILFIFAFLLAACKPAATSPTRTISPTATHISPTCTDSMPTDTAVPTVTSDPTSVTAPADTAAILKTFGGYPCPNSEFICVDIEVPLDHFNPAKDMMIAVDNEIYYLPEYYYWDVETPTNIGCPFGGTMHFEATDAGDILTLEQCAFINGFVLTGNGGNDYDNGLFTLNVTVSGVGTGTLSYRRDDNQGTYSLTGDYNGAPVELSR